MAISYKQAMEEFKQGFDKESWLRRERSRAKLKSFARLSFAKDVVRSKEQLEVENCDYFLKPYKFVGTEQIKFNAEAVRNLRMINEFLICALAEQIGLESATYYALQNGHTPNFDEIEDVSKVVKMPDALVSKDFLKENEELFDRDFFHYENNSGYSLKALIDDLKAMQKKDKSLKIEVEEIKTKFFKLMILDLLTLQLDRHEGNLPLILDTKTNTVRFGIVFDNEYAGNIKALRAYDAEIDEFKLLNDDGKIDVEKVISSFDKRIGKYSDYVWSVFPNCKKNYHAVLNDIVFQAKMSEKAGAILSEVLEKNDVESAFAFVEQLGVECSPAYREYFKQIVDYGKKEFKKEFYASKPSTETKKVEQDRSK